MRTRRRCCLWRYSFPLTFALVIEEATLRLMPSLSLCGNYVLVTIADCSND